MRLFQNRKKEAYLIVMTAATHPKKLNELRATAICGNDISSSCLYVSALTILYAGQFAWISLLLVAMVLFFYRRIYGEVVCWRSSWVWHW